MAKRPLIGLTTYGRKETDDYSLPAKYVDCVRRARGIPVLLPAGEPCIQETCDRLNGIILTGGGDIHPDRYNGISHPMIYKVDEERDETELRLVDIILNKNIPTLAICRGMQVLNTFLGGTLYEHIPDIYGESVLHRRPPRETIKHDVEISPGSRLNGIVSTSRMEIVSWHHQAVNEVPKEFTVNARSADGVIEGIEMDSHPWLIGVQWHPELSASQDSLQQQLFDVFVETSKKN